VPNDNVVSLADRVLGRCPRCCEPVVVAENFIRAGGAFLHVSCIARAHGLTVERGDFPRPAPPPVQGA
jgi:hypothetical protein